MDETIKTLQWRVNLAAEGDTLPGALVRLLEIRAIAYVLDVTEEINWPKWVWDNGAIVGFVPSK